MEGKWVTPSGEGQQCVCEETSQEAFSHSQQTPPKENQEKICSQGWWNHAWLPGGCRRDLMRPGDDKAGKGPLQKYGEAGRGAEQSLGTSCPPP